MSTRVPGLGAGRARRRVKRGSDWPDPGWLAMSLAGFVAVVCALVVALIAVGL
ncbi:MAG: hypothetical protein ACRDQA_25625 [Nocardioidaceae bacterium]